MSQALYRKWRPSQWEQVVGQDHIIQTLRNQVVSSRTRHAYLFAGPRGTGKTTTARLFAKAINCSNPDLASRPCDHCESCIAISKGSYLDLIEIDAASNTSVEDVRDLREKIGFSPNNPGGFKVYIIDEVHMLSNAAFNALLKTLEEPPPHAVFILATTDIGKIPATILSRCQRHEFRRIPVAEIVAVLQKISADEKLEVDEAALRTIARQATGALRDAISLLDQLASTGKPVTLQETIDVLGTSRSELAGSLVDAILERDSAAGLTLIDQALDNGADSRQLARQIVDYLRGLLLTRLGSGSQVDATVETRQEMTRQAAAFSEPYLLDVLGFFNRVASSDRTSGWHPGLQLEMAFASSLAASGSPAPRPQAYAAPAASVPQPQSPRQDPPPATAVTRPPVQSPDPAPVQTKPAPASPAQPAPRPSAPAPTPPRESRPASPAPEEAADSEAARSMFQTVTQSWPKVRALVKRQSPQTEALLNSGRLLGIKDGALLIGLSPMLKAKLESDDKLDIAVRAIQAVTGLTITVRCMEANPRPGSLPSGVQVEDDGIVGTALRDLGGEVVDIQ